MQQHPIKLLLSKPTRRFTLASFPGPHRSSATASNNNNNNSLLSSVLFGNHNRSLIANPNPNPVVGFYRYFTNSRSCTGDSDMTQKKVFLTRKVPQKAIDLLENCKSIELEKWDSDEPIPRAELLNKVQGKDGLCCLLTEKIDAELLDAAGPQLRAVSTMSVGYDHINVPDCQQRQVQIGNTPGVLTDATADLTMALLLATARRVVEATDAVKNGEWGTWGPMWMCGMELAGSTVGVIGLGRIGAAVAQRVKAFNVGRILYSGRGAKPDVAGPLGAEYVDQDTLLRESDIVIVMCALSQETAGMCDRAMFKKMKSSAILINSSRGGVLNQDDLYEALTSGEIGAAGLDVTTPEPLPPTHKLVGLPNCTIFPHIGSATMKTREAMAMRMAENMVAFAEGKEKMPFAI
eukprot:Nk52_evm8s309 gene=Nk52_evmTU8s309